MASELRQRKGGGGGDKPSPATTSTTAQTAETPPPAPLRALNYDALEALLSTTLVRKSSSDGALERLTLRDALSTGGQSSAHAVSLYFSAHWCPPCRAFTPELARMHARLTKDEGKKWPIIFVSMDSSAQAFGDYFSSMPAEWLAVPFEDDQLRSVLLRKMNVQGIPTLVMLDPRTAQVEASNARAAVSADAPEGKFFPWRGASGSGGPGGLLGNPRLLMMLLMLVYYAVVNVVLPWWRARSGGGGGV
jgi:thiol-disulfide isomerase/thioredoxin